MKELLNAAESAREVAGRRPAEPPESGGNGRRPEGSGDGSGKGAVGRDAARASAQTELADLTKQISDAKLAISGAQEEASAKTRDLQAVDARLKDESDRLAGMQARSSPCRPSGQVAGTSRRGARRPRRGAEPDSGGPKTARGHAKPDQFGDSRTQHAAEPDPRRQAPAQPDAVTRVGLIEPRTDRLSRAAGVLETIAGCACKRRRPIPRRGEKTMDDFRCG